MGREIIARYRELTLGTPNNVASHSMRCDALWEVAGFEPACSGDHLGLLRAQPAYGSHLGVSTGGRPLGQPGCDVPRWPPGGALAVSLLSDARTPTAGTRDGRLPRDFRQRARTRRWRLCWSGVLRDMGSRAAHPDGYPSESKPVHPRYAVVLRSIRATVSAAAEFAPRPSGVRHDDNVPQGSRAQQLQGMVPRPLRRSGASAEPAMAFVEATGHSFAGSPPIHRRCRDGHPG